MLIHDCFFSRERIYDEAGLTPEGRLAERQSLETKEILIRLRSRLDAELAKDPEFRSQYYTEALHYLKHFWDELFAFLDDGELPIDNNLADRCIRKLTTQRTVSSTSVVMKVLRWLLRTIVSLVR